jgi:hypothetical protein
VPRRLAAAQLANSVGGGASYVCSALCFTGVVGLSPARIGLGLTLAWAVGSVAGVPMGASTAPGGRCRVSGLVMAASCAVCAAAALPEAGWVAAALLVAGAALQADAEMRQSAGSWQIGFSLAPAERMGQYQGFFGTGVPVARTLGPLLLTALLLLWGIPGWLLLGALLLAASYAMGPAVRWAGAAAGSAAEGVRA